jgi:hypothetical protein
VALARSPRARPKTAQYNHHAEVRGMADEPVRPAGARDDHLGTSPLSQRGEALAPYATSDCADAAACRRSLARVSSTDFARSLRAASMARCTGSPREGPGGAGTWYRVPQPRARL